MTSERLRALWLGLVVVALIVIGSRNLQLARVHLFFGLLVGLVAATLVVFAITSRGRVDQ